MEEEVIISVKLDTKEAEKNATALTQKIAQQREELAKQRKALKESGGENAEAAKEVARLSREISSNNAELRRSQKEILAEDNSINSLRANINKLNALRNQQETATREGRAEFKRLTATLKDQREELNSLSKEAGSFRDNIGNYTESVRESIETTKVFGVSLRGLSTAFNQTVASIISVARALKSFRVALIATGVGAFVVVIASVITFFNRFQKAIDFVNEKLAGLKAGVDFVIEGFARFGGEVVDFIFGASDEVSKLNDEVQATNKSLLETVKAAEEIERSRQRLRDREIGFIVRRAQLEREISEKRAIAADQERSALERRIALEQANELVNRRAEEEIFLRKTRLELLKQEQSLGENLAADNKERAELEAEIIQLETQATNERREGISQLSGLRKAETDRIKREEEARQRIRQKAREERKKQDEKEREENKKANQELSKFAEKLRSDRANFAKRKENERVRDFTNSSEQIIDASTKEVDAQIANIDRLNDRELAEAEARKRRFEDEEQARRQLLGTTQSFFEESTQFAVQAFGEQSTAARAFLALQKTLSRAQIIVAGITEVQEIFKSFSSLGPVGQVLGAIRAAVAVARTANAVAQVDNVGFAGGGYTGDGGRFQPAGIVHKGEFVVSKPVVKRLGGANAVSRLTGQGVSGGFASGGLADSTAARIAADQQASQEINSVARAVENVRLFVAVKDINTGQDNFAKVQDLANQ